MRRILIVALLGLLLGAGLVALIEEDPGYVFLSIGDVTIETSFWFAVLLWLLAWALIALTLRILRRVLSTRRAFSGWLGGRKARNAAALTNRGLINYIEGNFVRSRKQLLRAARYSEAPLVNHLMAARASFRLGDLDETRSQLGIAESIDADAGVALELTQAELQLSAGRYEQALATLVRARANASKHPYVLELLARAHRALEEWEALRGLLPELRRHGLLETPALQGVESQMWHALLAQACGGDADVSTLDKLWQSIPLVSREADSMRYLYVSCLIQLDATAKAEKLLIDMLDKQWSTELVALVGTFKPTNSKKLLKALKRWLDTHGGSAALLLAAGRVALFAEQWQQAGEWLTGAYDAEPSPEVCLALARWHQSQGDQSLAEPLIAEAAMMAAGPQPVMHLPEPPAAPPALEAPQSAPESDGKGD